MSVGRTDPASHWGRVAGIAVGLAVVVGFLITAFAWPAAETAPRDVPLAVAGPDEAVRQVEQELAAVTPDAFDVQPVADEEAARALITDREVYGAVVIEPGGPPRVLTASAAGPAVAQVLNGVASAMSAQFGDAPTVAVEDVVTLPEDDPRGAGFNATALPMVMSGLLVGVGIAFGVAGIWRRVGGALIASAAGGLVAGLVVQVWLGTLEGAYWANAGVIALTIAAISLTLIGLHSLLGHRGIGLGALVVFLMGNPLSGVTTAPEMLPSGWGTLGQLLPPGAGGSLLRSTSFFDGAGAAGPLLVLSCWIAGGVLLAALGSARAGRANAESTSQAVPAAS